MQNENEGKRFKIVGLAAILGLLLTLVLLSGMSLAQEPQGTQATAPQAQPPDVQITPERPARVPYWLVLDPAQEVDEALPPLLNALSALQNEGLVVRFDPTPRRSDPAAVPCVRVMVRPEALDQLRHLPGVLDIVNELPPAPLNAALGALAVTGSISGVVTDESTGLPLSGVDVNVYDAVSFVYLDDQDTDANGRYAIAVTAPYSQARLYACKDGYVPEWYDDKPYFSQADAVALQAGGTVSNVNLALGPSGLLSLTLTLDGGGTPPNNVWVDVYDVGSESYVDGESADANGRLNMPLVSGTYKLEFIGGDFPGIVSEWYSDTDSKDNATLITITNEMTTEVTAQVTLNGVLSGTVTDESNGAKLAGIHVDIYDAGEDWAGGDWTGDGGWNPLGQYQIRLAPGTYRIEIEDMGVLYQSEWYSNANSFDTADWVTITGGVTTTANAALTPFTPTGVITGLLTHEGGQPLEGWDSVEIDLYDAASGDHVGKALEFWGDGSTKLYTVTVPAGEYKVWFWPWWSYQSEWYSDTDNISTADVVTVTAGGVTPDINADLDLYDPGTSCISGTLTSNGVPVQGSVRVYAYLSGSDGYWNADTYINSSENGVYEICYLYPGEYVVSFGGFPSATTWYSDTLCRSGATTVPVTVSTTTPNVDGSLDDLGACISGWVVDVGGQPRPDAEVNVYDADGNWIYVWQGLWGVSFTRYVYSDSDGGFVACGLQPGDYTLRARDGAMYGYKKDVVVSNTGQSVDAGNVVIAHYIYLPVALK